MGTLTVRELRESDLPRVMEIEGQCFTHPWSEAVFRRQLASPTSRLFAAEEDGTVLGYAALMSVLDEGEVANVGVAPEYRRRGVADTLLAALEARAREQGLTLLNLEARAGNAPAIALYEKHGFAPVGRRKNYYEKPREDAILMTKRLDE